MAIPQNILIDGEQILYEDHPAFWTMAKVLVIAIGTILVCTGVLKVFAVAVPILTGIWLWEDWWVWKRIAFTITNKRIITRRGTFFTNALSHCVHEKVQNIDLRTAFTPLGTRGTLTFDTAGGPVPELIWDNLKHPEDVYRRVTEILHK